MNEDKVYAKDIDCCNKCPIKDKDCRGTVGTSNGYQEPPCTSWNDDTLVYEGMYENL